MDSARDVVTGKFASLIDLAFAHKRAVITGLVLVLAGIGAFFGYRVYKKNAQIAAHQAFVQALKYYDAPVGTTSAPDAASPTFASEQEKWEKVEQIFAQGYQDHQGSKLAGMFLAFQSEAFVNLGKLDQAITILKEALPKIASEPVYDYYQVKLSLMQLDGSNEQEKNEALERLKMMTFETKSAAHDQALYQLGEYFWAQGNFEEAKNYWQQFMVKYGNDASYESQLKYVQSKLDLIAL